MTEMLATPYKNLKFLRDKAGLTQGELAERTGVAQSSISRMEKGEFEQSGDDTLKPFADFFKVSIAQLKYEDLTLANVPKQPPKPAIPKPEELAKKAPVIPNNIFQSPEEVGLQDSQLLNHVTEAFPKLTDKQKQVIVHQIDEMVSDNLAAYDVVARNLKPKR